MSRLATAVSAVVLASALSGCSTSADSGDGRTLTVLAASSLTGPFTELAAQFEAEHPGTHVKLVFDSSATLAQQAIDHAPGDVLATADQRTMDDASEGRGIKGEPIEFATNVLTLAVPKDNPARIRTFADLDSRGVDYLTCVPSAPCGAAAEALLAADGIHHEPVSQEVDVKSVLGKVQSGEADAGLVYRTDVTASDGKVTGIEIPGADSRPSTYWVAVTASAAEGGELAVGWIDFLTTESGQAVLKAAGFGTAG